MDSAFLFSAAGLSRALALLAEHAAQANEQSTQAPGAPELPATLPATLSDTLPETLPATGLGAEAALVTLAPLLLGGAAKLGAPTAFAHMDPPTPWVTWAATLWNASLNQNLLHPATAPVARDVEARVVAWLAPFFGMSGGHLTPGSTVANLTALWAARECAGVDTVVFSQAAHLSISKAAHLLGLKACPLPTDAFGALDPRSLPEDLSKSALVLTAGTTITGAIDPLSLAGQGQRQPRAAWVHLDAAWAGPLRLTKYAPLLAGLEKADSVAVSAHKWLFQPKESALVLFRDVARAHAALSFGGAYLAAPNIGLLGSHGATAVPLLAMLLAWGHEGLSQRIERCYEAAQELARHIAGHPRLELLAPPQTGVVLWRPKAAQAIDALLAQLPPGSVSVANHAGHRWLRNVAANPNADIPALTAAIEAAVAALPAAYFTE